MNQSEPIDAIGAAGQPADGTSLPVFPAEAPAAFHDPTTAIALLSPVLEELAAIVAIADADLDRPTPCDRYTVGELRNHVLAWLQFFAAALGDPDGSTSRLDPDTWTMSDDDDAATIVRKGADGITAALKGGAGERLVVMSQARMSGSAVAAMALGEYIVHGWDLAVATGRTWTASDEAATEARRFLEGVVTPDFRGPDSGFFDAEVVIECDAPPLHRLLAFAGRDPHWKP